MIKAILFDLGNTLMYSPAPWPPVYARAGRELADTLCASGILVNCETFSASFLERLEQYYTDRERNLVETTTLALLQDLLAEADQRSIPEDLLRAALDDFYAVTQQNWQLENDAAETLSAFQNSGYRLGLLSNAGDDRDVRQLLEKFNLTGYFDFILTSAACGYRKPHPQIFRSALANWMYLPDETAMVGDRLDADVGGARPLGIYTVWIKRRAGPAAANLVIPDMVARTLAEIPARIRSLDRDL